MGTVNGAPSPAPRDDNYAVNLEQARVFARGLAEHIRTCSAAIESAQSKAFRARADRAESRARAFESEASTLRTELYEIYRHIDAMTARFPELLTDPAVRN
ncbi:hypothetical protein ACIGGF_12350 [Rhodococcus sp. NPDC078407]|uniref:hypothetical protein n=1 Tax=Rhodococcus sp. NPDC078407 TaxID=3364509 RepID=UPI0037C780B1